MPSQQPFIEIRNLYKSYDDVHVLRGINFTVLPGEVLAIIGPSGSGKSTILKILSGLEKATSGSIVIREERIGMAFQYSALLNSYTVAENIAFALQGCALSKTQIDKIVQEKLEMIGLSKYADHLPDSLSGGQQKRVSFARAIANNPKVVFYDEPTAGLDPINSTILEDYINKLSQAYRNSSIVVTHQRSTIYRTAAKVICLAHGEIVWQGAVQELDTSQDPYIRQFMDGSLTGPFTRT